MTASSPSSTLIDDFLNAITGRPGVLVWCLVIALLGTFSIPSVLMGLLIFLLLHVTNMPKAYFGVFGGILAISGYLIAGILPGTLIALNLSLAHSLWSKDFSLFSYPYLWISSFPYGLILAEVFSWLSTHLNGGLKGEIKRVSKGRSAKLSGLSSYTISKILRSIKVSAYENGTILGVDKQTGEYAVLSDENANLHTLAIGTTGSGKTTGISNIVESAIIRKHPLIFVDGKGDLELARRIKAFSEKQNVPFYLFSMVGESVSYNPISSGGYTSKKDRIVELRHWSEDHYRKVAEGYLQTVFRILDKTNIPVDICTLSKYMRPESLLLLAREMKNSTLLSDIEALEGKTKDIQSLIAEIENLATSEIGHLFSSEKGEPLTLKNALEENAVVYFCLQPLAFPAYAETLGKLIINDLKALLASQLECAKKKKIFAIFDEFSVFAGDQIVNLINQGRGAGMHAVLSTQSLSDISKKGGDGLLGQVLNNCNNYIIQRQNNPEDAEILANVIGTQETFVVTSQVDTGNSGLAAGSVRNSKEFIVHPDEIKRLGLGESVLIKKRTFSVERATLRVALF